MSIIEKAFHHEENEITVIKCRDDIWFRGKDIAKALGYSIPRKVIREHVDPEDRLSLECLTKGGLKRTQKRAEKCNFCKREWSLLLDIAIQARIC